jgi:hypothetical protein
MVGGEKSDRALYDFERGCRLALLETVLSKVVSAQWD